MVRHENRDLVLNQTLRSQRRLLNRGKLDAYLSDRLKRMSPVLEAFCTSQSEWSGACETEVLHRIFFCLNPASRPSRAIRRDEPVGGMSVQYVAFQPGEEEPVAKLLETLIDPNENLRLRRDFQRFPDMLVYDALPKDWKQFEFSDEETLQIRSEIGLKKFAEEVALQERLEATGKRDGVLWYHEMVGEVARLMGFPTDIIDQFVVEKLGSNRAGRWTIQEEDGGTLLLYRERKYFAWRIQEGEVRCVKTQGKEDGITRYVPTLVGKPKTKSRQLV